MLTNLQEQQILPFPPFCFKECLELSAYWFLFFKWKAIKCPTHYPFRHIDYWHCCWLLVCSFNGMKMRTLMKWKRGGGCTRMLTPDFLIPFGNYANAAVCSPEMWTPQWSHIEPAPMIWDLSSLNPGNMRFALIMIRLTLTHPFIAAKLNPL